MTESQFRRVEANEKCFKTFEAVTDNEVLVNISEDAMDESVKAFQDAFKKLKGRINQVKTLEISKITNPQLLKDSKLEQVTSDWEPQSMRGLMRDTISRTE